MGELLSLKRIKSKKNPTYNDVLEKAIEGDKKSIEILINEHKEYIYKTAFIYEK